MGRAAIADSKVLLAPQQQNQIGVANLGGGAIETSLEKTEGVGMIVGDQTA